MRLILLSDIHNQTDMLTIIADDIRKADIVVVSGDLTNFSSLKSAIEVVDKIQELNPCIIAVHGNCDLAETANYLLENGISVHGCSQVRDNLNFVGIGDQWSDNSPSGRCARQLAKAFSGIEDHKPVILVTHQPAWGTAIDQPQPGYHAGNTIIRQFIQDYQPLLAVSGHIHEARGIDKIGKTTLINPGPLRDGCYAIVDIDTQDSKILDIIMVP